MTASSLWRAVGGAWLVLGLGVVPACKSKDAPSAAASAKASVPATAPAPSATPPGEDPCVAYQHALEACVVSAPDGAKPALKATLQAHRDAMATAPEVQRHQMHDGCRIGLSTLKQNPDCK
jgi:hypothetical protein